MVETNTELHEAWVLFEYGEQAEAYSRAQLLTKAFEAIGLSTLSKWPRHVNEEGQVIDFDSRLMREKTEAALHVPVAGFDLTRRRIEHLTQSLVLDSMQPGQKLIERSKHPQVPASLAIEHGYSPVDKWLMVRLYHRTEHELLLYNFPIAHGIGPEGITHEWASEDTTIESLLAEYDKQAEAATGQRHFLGVADSESQRDYTVIESQREQAEASVERHLKRYQNHLKQIIEAHHAGWINEAETLERKRRLERGFHTILLVELNPARAKQELKTIDYLWMQTILEFDEEDIFEAAYEVAERNELMFIACGGWSGPDFLARQEWYGAYKTIGRCVNCHEGPQEIGEKGWCRGCITGHCY